MVQFLVVLQVAQQALQLPEKMIGASAITTDTRHAMNTEITLVMNTEITLVMNTEITLATNTEIIPVMNIENLDVIIKEGTRLMITGHLPEDTIKITFALPVKERKATVNYYGRFPASNSHTVKTTFSANERE